MPQSSAPPASGAPPAELLWRPRAPPLLRPAPPPEPRGGVRGRASACAAVREGRAGRGGGVGPATLGQAVPAAARGGARGAGLELQPDPDAAAL